MRDKMNNERYRREISKAAEDLPVKSGTFLITGAGGLIGSCMTDVLLFANRELGTGYQIYVLGRKKERLMERFPHTEKELNFIIQDISEPLDDSVSFDYIIHAASIADPRSYAEHPVETILTNIEGTKNVLEYARKHPSVQILFTSTFEVYGKHEKDVYAEDDFGEVDQNKLRSGYPESKRTSELLCRSYAKEYDVKVVIGRLSSVYGPTMLPGDSKAHAEFIRNGLLGKDLLLKSRGEQKRTYCYVIDAVSGLFFLLFFGKTAEAYNVTNGSAVASIAEVAEMIAKECHVQVRYRLAEEGETSIYSRVQNCILSTEKISELGWHAGYPLREGIRSTLEILGENEGK